MMMMVMVMVMVMAMVMTSLLGRNILKPEAHELLVGLQPPANLKGLCDFMVQADGAREVRCRHF